jgi:heptosyltransferase-2
VAVGAALARRLRAGRYDAVALLHHLTTTFGTAKYAALLTATGAPVRAGLDNGRGWFLTHSAADLGFGVRHEVEYAEAVAATLGAGPDGGPLEFPITAEESAFAEATLTGIGNAPLIAIHPGSGAFSPARRWPVERFQQVAAALAQRGYRILVVGGPGERGLAERVCSGMEDACLNLGERTTLGQLAAVLARCDLFIGSDSGVMHLAAAEGTPVLAVFGPSNDKAWGPWPGRGNEDRARVLRVDLPCSPCFYTGYRLGTPQGCPARTCLTSIGPDDVVAAAREMLERKSLSPALRGGEGAGG